MTDKAFEAAQAALSSFGKPTPADNVVDLPPSSEDNLLPVEELRPEDQLDFYDKQGKEDAADPVPSTPGAPAVAANPNEVMLDVKIGDSVRQIKVDMNNKEQIQKAIVASVQAKHVMQQQREELATFKAQAEELKDYQASFGQVEQAFKSGGIEGLVNLMSGKEGAYQEFLSKQVTRELMRRDASPVELERLVLEEKLERLERSVKESEHRAKGHETQAALKSEQAEKTRVEGAIHPAFDKHRLAGQLGDPVLESRMDKAIWIAAMDELKEFAEQNGQAAVTAQISNRIFEDISKSIKGAFSSQANKEAIKSSEKRKADAGFQVSAAAMANQGSASSRQTDTKLYNEYLRTGNYAGMLELQLSGRAK